MAREGLRTLVVAKRALTEEQYQDFEVSQSRSPSALGHLPRVESLLPRVPGKGVSPAQPGSRGRVHGVTRAPSLQSRYSQAKLSIHDRALKVAAVVESLEREMELLCLTGVEDQLQADVRPTLEMLRNAGIKVPCAPASTPSPGAWWCKFSLSGNCFLTSVPAEPRVHLQNGRENVFPGFPEDWGLGLEKGNNTA